MQPDHGEFEGLRNIVADCLGLKAPDIDAQTCAKNTPEWDSLAHMMILDAIEKRFRIKLPRLAAYTAKNLGELLQIVAGQLQQR